MPSIFRISIPKTYIIRFSIRTRAADYENNGYLFSFANRQLDRTQYRDDFSKKSRNYTAYTECTTLREHPPNEYATVRRKTTT